MPSPTTLAMNKKLRTHQLILLTSGRGRSSGRTIGQIPIRSQNLQITCTVKSQKELLKIKKKKKKHSRCISLGFSMPATPSASQFTFSEPYQAIWVKLGTFHKL